MPQWKQPPDKLSQQYDEKIHKLGCTAAEDSLSLEILYVRSAGNILSNLHKHSSCNLTAQLLRSCSELFWHMESRFPHDVAQMHHEQIRDLRVPHSSPLCLLIDV